MDSTEELKKHFERLFDNSSYVPHPIELEGMKAYQQKQPISSCPYKDDYSKNLWEHGWNTTDVGHFIAAQYPGEEYDDPKNWK